MEPTSCLGLPPHAYLGVRERVPQKRLLESHLTHNFNGLSQRRSRSLTSRQLECFNEGLGVLPHLRLKLRILKKVLESHLTYNKIMFQSNLNTRSFFGNTLPLNAVRLTLVRLHRKFQLDIAQNVQRGVRILVSRFQY